MTRLNEQIHEDLQKPVLQKLFAKSIFTAIGFVQTESSVLSNITGLQYKKILQIKNAILHKFSSPIKLGNNYYKDLLTHGAIISTGIEKLDNLLGGGLFTGNVYEVCGLSASGKTQLCMTIAANVSKKLEKQSILFISTKNDINAHRVEEIIKNQPKKAANISSLMLRIKICLVSGAYELLALLHKISKDFKTNVDESLRYRLIIIDSLTACFHHFLGNKQNEGLCILNNVANVLNYITAEYHTVAIITNLITSWTLESSVNEVSDEESYFPQGSQTIMQPALGKYWAHIPNTRVVIQKLSSSSECIITILKSTSELIGKTIKVSISDSGIR